MKMNDYKNVLNRMHPNENLENEIIEKCMNTETKKLKKRRFAPVIAVALSLCIGTVGVSAAMNFDWIKSFFKDDFVISEDIESLVAQTSNYECWSNCGIKMSLDGVVADEQSIYCQFNIDEMPEGYDIENLYLWDLASESYDVFGENTGRSATFYGSVNDEGKYIVSYSADTLIYSGNDKIAVHLYNNDEFFEFANGKDEVHTLYDQGCENYPYDLMTAENLEIYNHDMDYVLIKFDIEFDNEKIPSVKISEDKIQHNGLYSTLFKNIEITPFKMLCGVSATDYIDVKGKIILDNGDEITLESDLHSGYGGIDENGINRNEYLQIWTFSKPVNPEDVVEIYIRNECIYTK